MSGLLGKAVGKKMAGDKPSAIQAALGAAVAGAAVAVATYRLMRG